MLNVYFFINIFSNSSSIWTTPSPSQRPMEPPKSAKNVEKLNFENPYCFSRMIGLKEITIEEPLFLHDVEVIIVPLVTVDLITRYWTESNHQVLSRFIWHFYVQMLIRSGPESYAHTN